MLFVTGRLDPHDFHHSLVQYTHLKSSLIPLFMMREMLLFFHCMIEMDNTSTTKVCKTGSTLTATNVEQVFI